MKHISAPWTEGGNEFGHGIIDSDGNFVCHFNEFCGPRDRGQTHRKEANKARAKLLVAAPDLLEAAQQSVIELIEAANVLEGQHLPSLANIYRQAASTKQAAIDKATK